MNSGDFTGTTSPSAKWMLNGENGPLSTRAFSRWTVIGWPRLAFHGNPHAPRRPRDDPGGVVVVEGVQVLALFLGDGLALLHRQLADLGLVRLAAALLGLDGVLQQDAGRRTLELKFERAVLVDCHED